MIHCCKKTQKFCKTAVPPDTPTAVNALPHAAYAGNAVSSLLRNRMDLLTRDSSSSRSGMWLETAASCLFSVSEPVQEGVLPLTDAKKAVPLRLGNQMTGNMTSETKAVIFDLDGTLTDTLADLANSTNFALRRMGMPTRTVDEVRQFVGNGVGKLIERAVPEGTDSETTARCLSVFRGHYVEHCMDNTRLYPGVDGMLDTLHRQGYRIAIVSNKLQAGVDELYDRFFRRGTVDLAIGEREGVRRKPAPDMLRLALSALKADAGEAVYVGDSDVDIETARNTGVECISVLWGFRDEDFLRAHDATSLAASPEDVVRLVNARANMA